MAQGTTAIKFALWVLLLLALSAWVLAIVGLAGLQRQCYFERPLETGATDGTGAFAGNLPFVGIRGLNRGNTCDRIYSYYWFMIAMQLITLLGLLVLSCVRLLAASALAWLSWLVVLTALFMQGSDTMLAVTELADKESLYGNTYHYGRLASCGFILTSVWNLAIVWALGWRPRKLLGSGATSLPKY